MKKTTNLRSKWSNWRYRSRPRSLLKNLTRIRRTSRQMPLSRIRSRHRRIKLEVKQIKLTLMRQSWCRRRQIFSNRFKRPFLTRSTRLSVKLTRSRPRSRVWISSWSKSRIRSTRWMCRMYNYRRRPLTLWQNKSTRSTRASLKRKTSKIIKKC